MRLLKPSEAQRSSLEQIPGQVSLFVKEGGIFEVSNWETCREAPECWGHELQKAYQFILEGISPALPTVRGATVALEGLVGEEARFALLDPSRLALPEEIVTPLPHASVNVESQREWNRICQRLFELGLVEPEVETETVRF